MNVREFLSELAFYFSLKRSSEDAERLMESYVNDIFRTLSKYKGFECDFEKLLYNIRCERSYSTFPLVADILKEIPKALKPKNVQISYSGREGEVVKRMVNGAEYEFTIVPNHWQGIKTLSQLDAEIAQKGERKCKTMLFK